MEGMQVGVPVWLRRVAEKSAGNLGSTQKSVHSLETLPNYSKYIKQNKRAFS